MSGWGTLQALRSRTARLWRRLSGRADLPRSIPWHLLPRDRYVAWIERRIRERGRLFPPLALERQPEIDILTLVSNTSAPVLASTAASVRNQHYSRYRWVIWDNGSTAPETLSILDHLRTDDRVKVYRHPTNLGITAGHRAALEHCSSEYVALLDHDDLLYPDALNIAGHHILKHGRPALLYSDEDKVDGIGPFFPFFKPDWSPAFLRSTGYTCHLTLFSRKLAEPLGLFSDDSVEGTQDWDLALRFLDAGYAGVHIPEVLYSWRVLVGSTSRVVSAKSYVLENQRSCLESSLQRCGLEHRFEVISSPVYPFEDGHWHIRRRDQSLPPVEVISADAMPEMTASRPLALALQAEIEQAEAEFIAYVPPGVEACSDDWLLDAISILELHEDAALVGGRVLDGGGALVSGPVVLGMEGCFAVPHRGLAGDHVGYFGLILSTRDVAAVWQAPWIARRQALLGCPLGVTAYTRYLFEVDLCLRLAQQGWRVLFAPHVTGWTRQGKSFGWQALAADPWAVQERETFLVRYAELLDCDPWYCPHLSLEPSAAYQLATPRLREQVLRSGRPGRPTNQPRPRMVRPPPGKGGHAQKTLTPLGGAQAS